MDPISNDSKQSVPQSTNKPTSGVPRNKRTLIISGIIAAVLVLLIVIVVVLVSVFSVSKNDYREALNKYGELRTANSTLSRKVSTLSYTISSATDTSFKNDVEAVEEELATIKSENEELGKLKAVRVGEGAKVYKAFDEKVDAYLSYSGGLLKSIENVREPLVSCNEATKGVSSSTDRTAVSAAIKICTDKITAVKDIPDADIKAFIIAFGDSLKELNTIIGKLSAITDPFGAQYDQYKVLRDQTNDIQKDLRNTSKDLTSNLEKRENDTSPKNESEALSKFLIEKSSK